MKKLFIFFCLLVQSAGAQHVNVCRQRFNTYLNFHGGLGGQVRFDKDAITVLKAGKPDLKIYEEEIPALSKFLQNSSLKEQDAFFSKKGLNKLGRRVLDSLATVGPEAIPYLEGELSLKGYKIALDPGHFSITLAEAKYEQKYLYFPSSSVGPADSVKLFESALTFNTASILKQLLEEKGATVFLSRDKANHTSFNCTFSDWLKLHKSRHLDSLVAAGQLTAQKRNSLLKSSTYDLFWNFFRYYDLANRSKKINEFAPHLTLIIHYNVDEKNVPWNKHTQKNFTMAFIGGAFTADNLSRGEGRANFLRLLLTDQLNRSQLLAEQTVGQFHKNLEIKIANATDADYLKNNCLVTSSPGVYCRNLALCRKINSPLVYGESLYQDNEKESIQLMQNNLDLYGLKTNERLRKVALSYYEGLLAFLKIEASR